MTLTPINKVSIFNLGRGCEKKEAEAEKIILQALKALKSKKISVDIYLAGGKVMKDLNVRLRGKDYSADVLSFEEPSDFIEPESKYRKIGEIFLNSSATETKNLLVHGLLHLFGYSHQNSKEAAKMEKKEKEILNQI